MDERAPAYHKVGEEEIRSRGKAYEYQGTLSLNTEL